MKLKIRDTFVLECPCYNFIRDNFPSLFENEVSIKESSLSSRALDYQVDISLDCNQLLSRNNLADTIFMYSLVPYKPFGFPDYEINFISFHVRSTVEPGDELACS